MVHLSVIRILRLRSASDISIAGLVGFRFLLDSGLHVADAVTEAPLAAARDVDDAAPLVTAAREGRLAALRQLGLKPRMPREPEQRAPLVGLCYATRSC
jgi:hypothetical protein